MPLPNPSMSFTPFDTLPASDLNDLVENIEALADGTGFDAGAIPTAAYANSSVTADKLATGAAGATVSTGQSTSSTSYVDLATVGAAVTVTVGVNGIVLINFGALINITSSGGLGYISFALSGANTAAASDDYYFVFQSSAANRNMAGGRAILLTGLTPGSTTFTMKYKAVSSTVTFSNRRMAVIPL